MKKVISSIATLMALVCILTACNNNSSSLLSESNTHNILNRTEYKAEQILNLIAEYGKISSYCSYEKTEGKTGNKKNVELSFSVGFTDVQLLSIIDSEEEGFLLVEFVANVEDDFYIVGKKNIVAIIKTITSEKLEIDNMYYKDNEKPFIEPTVPFDIEFIFEQNNKLRFVVPETRLTEDNLARYEALQDIQIEYQKGIYIFSENEKTYQIIVPLTHENIVNIELTPQSEENKTIGISPFSLGTILVFTLSNGMIITYMCNAKYLPKKNMNKYDYWDFGLIVSMENCKIDQNTW